MIRITTKIEWFRPCPVFHISTEFCENRFNGFCVILLTDKHTNADENINSLAEVNMKIGPMISTQSSVSTHGPATECCVVDILSILLLKTISVSWRYFPHVLNTTSILNQRRVDSSTLKSVPVR